MSANLVSSMRGFLQISPTNMSKTIATKHLFFRAPIPLICSILELLRSRNGSEVTPQLNALHDILTDLVNSMRGYLQISPTNINQNIAARHLFFHGISISLIVSILELPRPRNGSGMAPQLNTLHDILPNLVNSMRGFLQISPTNIHKNIATRQVFFWSSIPLICSILELLRLRNGSGMTLQLKALHDILADLVNSMRGFLQISPTNINEKIAIKHLFFHGINTFYLLCSTSLPVR